MATIVGTNLDDVLATTASVDVLTALNGNDFVLVALAADHGATENLNGGAGFDRLWFTSTSGADSLVVLAATAGFEAIQIVDEAGNSFGTTALDLNASALGAPNALAPAIGALLAGNDGANLITGSTRNDILVGGGGADTLLGGLGNDRIVIDVTSGSTDAANAGVVAEGNTLVLVGAAPGAAIIDLAVADQLVSFGVAADATVQSGFAHVDASGMGAFGVQITGSAIRNVLTGSAGNDVFIYASPADYLSDAVSGGGGDDVLRFSSITPLESLTLNGGLFGVERVEIASATGDITGTVALNLSAAAVKAGVTLVGNDGINVITGSEFGDKLYGNGGGDTLSGGGGNDLYFYDNASDGVASDRIVDSGGAADYIAFTDTVAGATLVLGAGISGIEGAYAMGPGPLGAFNEADTVARNIDGAALLAGAGMKFTGNAGANTLIGGSGNDTLIGNGGADTIIGGPGTDVIEMDVTAGSVDVIDAGNAAEGNILRLTGDLASGMVVIDLGVAANADQILSIDGAADAATQSDFTHVNASALTGDYGVTITGSARGNVLIGSPNVDVFAILSPAEFNSTDNIQGGAGNDNMRFISTTAGQTLVVGTNITSVEEVEISDLAGLNTGLVALNLDATAAKYGLMLSGNDGANTIVGSVFNDVLNGNGGIDLLAGGLGDDEYLYDSAADFVVGERINDAAGLADRIRFASATDGEVLTLSAQVTGIEILLIGPQGAPSVSNIGINAAALANGISASGNDGANTIIGTNFNDVIDGGKGFDNIVGGLGRDTISINVDSGHQDAANAGLYSENNLLRLYGVEDVTTDFDLSVAQGVDQSVSLAGIQSGFVRVDGSALLLGNVAIKGSTRGDILIGSNNNGDYFEPGLGDDTIDGGAGNDIIVVHSQAELGADIYIGVDGSAGDYLYFDNPTNGATLFISAANIRGWDVAATGLSRLDTTNLNINAAAVLNPFSLAGNAGNNVLTGTFSGESIFDYGGRDTMIGGGGSDDYVIIEDWVDPVLGVGDKIIDSSGTQDDLYNATLGQIIVVRPAMITGIERFVVSGADLAHDGGIYVRDIEATNNGGFDLSLWTTGTHIAGSFGDNYLKGTAFSDTIIGHKGTDTIIGGLGRDFITMEPGLGNVDAIDAGAYAERNQLILKGKATGTMVWNLGVAQGQDELISIGGSAEGLVQSGFLDLDATGVEEFGVEVTGGAQANTFRGSEQDDVLDGRGGVDILIGGGGNDAFVVNSLADFVVGDVFDGGNGTGDTVRFASTVAGQTLLMSVGQMLGIEAVDIANAAGNASGVVTLNVNASGFGVALKMHGNDGVNVITGTAFADTLAGGGGADTLRGNGGNDIYTAFAPGEVVAGDAIVDTEGTLDIFRFTSETDGDVVILTNKMAGLEIAETADKGGLLSGIADTGVDASAVVNKLIMRGNAGDNQLTGTAFADNITGGLGKDVIVGRAGKDTITMMVEAPNMDDVDGGAMAEGNQLVLVGHAAGNMVWDLSSASDQLISVNGVDDGHIIRNITHLDASRLAGAPVAVTITGSAEANVLIGGSGNDVFIEKSAADFAVGERITASIGYDVLRFTSTGTDTLVLTNLVTGIESLQISDAAGVLTGTAAVGINAAGIGNALKIEGNDGANVITGTAFADTIIGGAGKDVIVGGAGNDVITMQVSVGDIDAINAGAGAGEANKLVLVGAAGGAVVVNLTIVGGLDQLTAVGDTFVQSGFVHLDASAMTGGTVTVTGTAGNNFIAGGALADTIIGGAGNDTIGFDVGGGSDQINAGALTETNSLVLTGVAPGVVVVDLSQVGDQVTSIGGADAVVQSGFVNLDASAMTGAGVNVTGSAVANIIVGSAQADTIAGGAGADRIVWDAGTASDSIDAGNPSEGDTFVLKGTAAGFVVVNLAVAPGADQLLSINAVADAVVQADFQHLDARDLAGGGLQARGNGLNNTFYGSNQADSLTGMGGADRFWLGGGDGVDAAADKVIFEGPQDGMVAAGAAFSFDVVREFSSGQDRVVLTAAFNGGPTDLDDITADDVFNFATNARADFASAHEAMLITQVSSGLTGAGELSAAGFATVVAVINKAGLGVKAATGDDGLIVIQAGSSAGVYYYQESDGVVNSVGANELTLLGVFDAPLAAGDLMLV